MSKPKRDISPVPEGRGLARLADAASSVPLSGTTKVEPAKLASGGKYQNAVFAVVVAALVLGAYFLLKYQNIDMSKYRTAGNQNVLNAAGETHLSIPAAGPSARGEVFRISSGEHKGPDIRGGFVDPYLPKIGEKQILSVDVSGKRGVTAVQVVLNTDTRTERYNLKMVGGTETDGKWQGMWAWNDTYKYAYNIDILASDGEVTSSASVILKPVQ